MHDIFNRLSGGLAWLTLTVMRLLPLEFSSRFCGWIMRKIGPHLKVARMARRQLQSAFPNRDPAWIEATLLGVWDNLGRVGGEYPHMDRLWSKDSNSRIEIPDEDIALFERHRQQGKPALAFTAHMANWELPALLPPHFDLPSAVVYRMPNNKYVAAHILRIREKLMGRLVRARATAGFELNELLEQGVNVGMLVDQHFSRGVDVTFFGRTCRANPTIARLARKFDCPVLGIRVIRLPDCRFRLETQEITDLPRDADGLIDVQGAMQKITSVIEGWIREHPEQWLWLHRRWR